MPKKITLELCECDSQFNLKTHNVDGINNICITEKREFSKQELLDVCKRAAKISRGNYGFQVYFKDENKYQKINVRFENYTTNSKKNVLQHIETYWDWEKIQLEAGTQLELF